MVQGDFSPHFACLLAIELITLILDQTKYLVYTGRELAFNSNCFSEVYGIGTTYLVLNIVLVKHGSHLSFSCLIVPILLFLGDFIYDFNFIILTVPYQTLEQNGRFQFLHVCMCTIV